MHLVYISYALILTLVTCIILVFISRLVDEYYSIITFSINWVILDFIFLLYSIYIVNSLWWYSLLTSYLITLYIVTKIGNNGKSFIFGILMVLFQSEYWEIFIHLYHGDFYISTIIMSMCIIYTMVILKLDYVNFIYGVLIFLGPYYMLTGIFYPLSIFRGHQVLSDFFFRIICSIFSISLTYYINKTHGKDNIKEVNVK